MLISINGKYRYASKWYYITADFVFNVLFHVLRLILKGRRPKCMTQDTQETLQREGSSWLGVEGEGGGRTPIRSRCRQKKKYPKMRVMSQSRDGKSRQVSRNQSSISKWQLVSPTNMQNETAIWSQMNLLRTGYRAHTRWQRGVRQWSDSISLSLPTPERAL